MFRIAKLVARKTARPTAYAALATAILWIGVDLMDGASDRFHQRVDQVKVTANQKADDSYDATTAMLNKLLDGVESNPIPVVFSLVMAVLTVAYNMRKGRTILQAAKATLLKESPTETPNPLIQKLQREALESQMLDKFHKLQARAEDLPCEIAKASEKLREAQEARDKAEAALGVADQFYLTKYSYHKMLVTELEDAKVTIVQLELEFDNA